MLIETKGLSKSPIFVLLVSAHAASLKCANLKLTVGVKWHLSKKMCEKKWLVNRIFCILGERVKRHLNKKEREFKPVQIQHCNLECCWTVTQSAIASEMPYYLSSDFFISLAEFNATDRLIQKDILCSLRFTVSSLHSRRRGVNCIML